MEGQQMIKIIYHGSEKIIEKPIFGCGKKYNDYGLGFYCTENKDLAKEWSVDWNRNGYANAYEIEIEGLNILHLNDGNYCILHWLTLLLKNRQFDVNSSLALEAKQYLINNFDVPLDNVDIIIGYRADDSYFSFASDFINGTISYRQLNNAIHLGKLGEQFVLISKTAFNKIKFLNAELASSDEWFAKKAIRDKNTRFDYFKNEKNKRQRGDLYITTILDEEIKKDDFRLR